MLLRIFLVVAILAGLGSGGVAYYEFSTQIPALTKQRNDEKDQKVAEIAAHTKTKAELKKTQGILAQTQQELADTKSERDKAVARAEAQSKRADELNDKLTKANSDLQEAQDQLAAYKASDLTPDQVVKLYKNLKEAQAEIVAINGEKAVLQRQLTATKAELDKFIGGEAFVKLPYNLRGKVVLVDPKWDFVVLDIGDVQGAVNEGELLVSRDGKIRASQVRTIW